MQLHHVLLYLLFVNSFNIDFSLHFDFFATPLGIILYFSIASAAAISMSSQIEYLLKSSHIFYFFSRISSIIYI